MHRAGVPLKAQQAILGHSEPNITLLMPRRMRAESVQQSRNLGNQSFPSFPKSQPELQLCKLNYRT
jgi:hypothetical protein